MFVNFNVNYLLFNLLYSDIAPFYTHFIRKHKPIDFKRFQISETVLWPIKTELYTYYMSAISGTNSRTMHCLIKSSLDVIYFYNSKVDWQFQFKMIKEGKENLIFTALIALMPTKKRGKFQSNIKLNLAHVIMMLNLIFFLCKKWK